MRRTVGIVIVAAVVLGTVAGLPGSSFDPASGPETAQENGSGSGGPALSELTDRLGVEGSEPMVRAHVAEQAVRNLRTSEDLMGSTDRDGGLREAWRIGRHQARALGVDVDGEAPPCDRSGMASVRDGPLAIDGSVPDAVGDVVDAYCAFATATRTAYADADPAKLAAIRDALQTGRADRVGSAAPFRPEAVERLRAAGLDPAADEPLLFQAGVDRQALAGILSARTELVREAAQLRDGLDGEPAVPVPVCRPGAVCIDLRRDHDRTYEASYALQIDRGGDDVYRNEAGGASHGAAALVDLGGDDTYNATAADGRSGRTGGGEAGAGFLYDAAGDDRYLVRYGADGDGSTAPGETIYAAHGGSYLGVGFLYDGAGDDVYAAAAGAGVVGANGGGWGGPAALVDRAGDDVYRLESPGTGTIAVNGGSERGVGVLYDAAGDDVYTVRSRNATWGTDGVNGGSLQVAGLLVDGAGDDRYKVATSGGRGEGPVNGGGSLGAGLLRDRAGDDVYTVTMANVSWGESVNGGARHGVGVLLDDAGDDAYRTLVETADGPDGSASANGGADAGAGFLVDRAGIDRFDELFGYTCDNDVHDDCTEAPKGVAGALVDGGSS